MVSEQQCCQNLRFSYILLENFTKTLEGTKKTKVLVPKRWRVPKKPKQPKFWSLELPNYPMRKNFFFFLFFLVPSCVLAPKLWFFWDLFKVLRAFWSKTLPKPWRVRKKTKFWCQNAGGYKKNKKNKVFEHWVVWQLKTPKLFFFFFFFFFFVFLVPSCVLAPKLWFFWYPPGFWQGFAPKCSQNTERSQKPRSGHGFWKSAIL